MITLPRLRDHLTEEPWQRQLREAAEKLEAIRQETMRKRAQELDWQDTKPPEWPEIKSTSIGK